MRMGKLHKGDLVEVRTAVEILATLAERGALESMPFTPEMPRYSGRRFVVDKRTEKVCYATVQSRTSRRLPDAVMLEDLRRDGSAHGGCQAQVRDENEKADTLTWQGTHQGLWFDAEMLPSDRQTRARVVGN
jgi:hypothetical protein